jgi:hypothetical protein
MSEILRHETSFFRLFERFFLTRAKAASRVAHPHSREFIGSGAEALKLLK